MNKKAELTRKQAAKLLEDIAQIVTADDPREYEDQGWGELARRVADKLREAGVNAKRCTGEAHKNPHIDNCMQCAPHWGTVVTEVKIR